MHVLSPNDLVSDSKPNRIVDTGVPEFRRPYCKEKTKPCRPRNNKYWSVSDI